MFPGTDWLHFVDDICPRKREKKKNKPSDNELNGFARGELDGISLSKALPDSKPPNHRDL